MTTSPEALMQLADHKIRLLIKQIDPADLALHNDGYAPEGDLFSELMVPERGRYMLAMRMLDGLPPGRAVDLGCFLPYMPILLTEMGWEVTAVDRYSLFGPSVHEALRETAHVEGFALCDLDMTTELDRIGDADLVLLMAVIEHLNGSPLELVRSIGARLEGRDGRLLLEVPNIATLWHRIQLLRGISPLPDYRSYLRSSYPFSGHNREMTIDEVRMLLDEAGFDPDRVASFDYSPPVPGIKAAALRLLQRAIPSCRETIMAVARPRRGE